MIGKVDIDYSSLLSQNYGEKINELVDAVNTIQKERDAERFEIQEWIDILEAVRKSVNVHEKQIDELQLAKDVMFNRIDVFNNAIYDIQNKITALEDPTYYEEPADNSEKANRQGNVQPDAESRPENVQDKFAEQRKWIGKLCHCWDSYINDDVWGILQDIKDNKTEKYYLYGIGYEHCEPVKPDADIIYKGE